MKKLEATYLKRFLIDWFILYKQLIFCELTCPEAQERDVRVKRCQERNDNLFHA